MESENGEKSRGKSCLLILFSSVKLVLALLSKYMDHSEFSVCLA